MTAHTFRTLPFEFRDTGAWRSVDLSQMPEEDKTRFLKLKAGIEDYLSTGKLKQSAKTAGCNTSNLLRHLNRCVATAGDGQIFGWLGLVKHFRVKAYSRNQAFPAGDFIDAGNCAGAFGAFLKKHPSIHEMLDALILKKAIKGQAHQARISFKDITRKFRNLCLKEGVQENEYPLNTESKGRRSIARYANQLIAENGSRAAWARYGDDAWKHLRVGTGHSSLAPQEVPMRTWGLDSHKIDCIGCVIVPGPAGPQKIAIERIWFIPTLDAGSKAVMGYSVGIRTEVSAETIEESLANALLSWRPKTLSVPGAVYPEGAALPNYVYPELVGCGPALLKIDNALQHYAKRIIGHARLRLGCAISWGGIGRWDHNAIVERLFRSLESYGFHKLPSTTGSSPTDPLRRDAVKEALKLGIEWKHLLEILDVIVAEYNAALHRGVGGRSPLQVLGEYLDPAYPRILLRPLPEPSVRVPELGVMTIICTVRGGHKSGVRPYVEWHGRYTNGLLSHAFNRVGEKIVLHLKTADVSKGEAFTLQGESLGVLQTIGAWGKTPHSADIRREIGRLMNSAAAALPPGEDIVDQYLTHFATKAREDARKRPRGISKAATKVARTIHETGRTPPAEDYRPPTAPTGDKPVRSLTGIVKTPSWKTVT